jgi:hypothetical protein
MDYDLGYIDLEQKTLRPSATRLENKTIDATVCVGGGVPFHCTVLGLQSAREQANATLKALRDQK